MKRLFGQTLILAAILTLGLAAHAQITPIHAIRELRRQPKATDVLRVTTARVVMADYDLLKKDFPELRALGNDQIDEWLLNHTAVISSTQVKQTIVNTPIQTAPGKQTAYRPPGYNRALVMSVPEGLIDGKGFGAQSPGQHSHGNGLATTGEMIREFLYQKLVQKIFDFSGTGRQTVGSYAVIDWGFNVVHENGSQSPAGAVLRQAHRRSPLENSLLSDEESSGVERLLRVFGITSAGADWTRLPEDRVNIQGTDTGAVLDFGGFLAVNHFAKNVRSYTRTMLFTVDSPLFVEPDPTLQVPLSMWGTTVSGVTDPKLDNVWIWSHELAEAFASGRATRAAFDQHLHNFLDPVDRIFKAHASVVTFGKAPLCLSVFH